MEVRELTDVEATTNNLKYQRHLSNETSKRLLIRQGQQKSKVLQHFYGWLYGNIALFVIMLFYYLLTPSTTYADDGRKAYNILPAQIALSVYLSLCQIIALSALTLGLQKYGCLAVPGTGQSEVVETTTSCSSNMCCLRLTLVRIVLTWIATPVSTYSVVNYFTEPGFYCFYAETPSICFHTLSETDGVLLIYVFLYTAAMTIVVLCAILLFRIDYKQRQTAKNVQATSA